jgi:hypothetical protein
VTGEWISFRHPSYPLNSASHKEGRYNRDGQTAFYLASGDYCGQIEVPEHLTRIRTTVAPTLLYGFDLPRFAAENGFQDALTRQREEGGWDICQSVSDFLTQQISVTGVLYQSAAMHQQGQTGYCMVVLPMREQDLPPDFFRPT